MHKQLKTSIDAFVAEMSRGKFLKINQTEDGVGTYWTETTNLLEAYYSQKVEELKEICSFEFSNFPEGYPKFRLIHFAATEI